MTEEQYKRKLETMGLWEFQELCENIGGTEYPELVYQKYKHNKEQDRLRDAAMCPHCRRRRLQAFGR